MRFLNFISRYNYFGVLCCIIFNIYLFFYMFLFPYPSRPRFLNFFLQMYTERNKTEIKRVMHTHTGDYERSDN
ncbi:hypothetical protein Hanom_Chr09g00867551 [Helianthus anomalus]